MSRRPLYGFLVAEAVSITGTRISMIAIPWLVLTSTGSATRTGVVALAELAPLVLAKTLAGPLIDRLGARRVSIACDVGSVFGVGLIPVLHEAGRLPFPLLLALVAVAGALRGPGDGAKAAIVPQLVADAGVSTERATGLCAGVERTASTVGAAVAGGLVALVGAADALYVDAASFAVAVGVFAWATVGLPRPALPSTDGASDGDGEPYLRQLGAGWHFLRADRLLLGIAVMVALTNLLDAAYVSVLVPVWGHDTGGGAGAVGLVFAVFSGASVLGALAAAAWGGRLPRYVTYLVTFLLAGAPRFLVLAAAPRLAWVLAVCVAGGLASGLINPILGAVMLERIPAPLLGRVESLTSAMCWSLMPLGGLLGGLMISGAGLATTLLACGAAYALVTLAPALDHRWREMDRRPQTVPTELTSAR